MEIIIGNKMVYDHNGRRIVVEIVNVEPSRVTIEMPNGHIEYVSRKRISTPTKAEIE